MKILKIVYIVLRNIFIFVAITATLSGVTVREGIIGYLITGLIWAIAMMLVPTIVDFFRLPNSFVANLLIGILLSILVFVAYRYLVVGLIDFSPMTVGGSFISGITLPVISLDKLGAVIYTAIITSTFSVIMGELSAKK